MTPGRSGSAGASVRRFCTCTVTPGRASGSSARHRGPGEGSPRRRLGFARSCLGGRRRQLRLWTGTQPGAAPGAGSLESGAQPEPTRWHRPDRRDVRRWTSSDLVGRRVRQRGWAHPHDHPQTHAARVEARTGPEPRLQSLARGRDRNLAQQRLGGGTVRVPGEPLPHPDRALERPPLALAAPTQSTSSRRYGRAASRRYGWAASRLLDDSGRTGVRPDSVQVLGGMLASRLPTRTFGCGSIPVCVLVGCRGVVWLERGLLGS